MTRRLNPCVVVVGVVVVAVGALVACEPPAPTTPVTIGDKIKASHGAPSSTNDATERALKAAGEQSPGKDQLGDVPPGLPSPHGSHGSPGVVGVGGASAIAKATDSDVILKVDGRSFTKGELMRSMKQAAALAGIPPEMLDAQMTEAFEQPAYEKLIERTLLVKEATRRGLWPSEAEAKDKQHEMLKTLPKDKKLDDVLVALGADQASFDNDLRIDLAIAKLLQNIEKGVPTPPASMIDSIYAENQSVFTIPDTASASHILVKADRASGPVVLAERRTRAEALKALVQGKDAATFAKVAAEHSEDATGPGRGGDLGVFRPGDLAPELDAVAFKLKEGEIAGPVQTDRGFHIVRGGGVQKGRTVPAQEAKSIIAERERTKVFLAAVDDLIDTLRAGAVIERVVEPTPSPLVDKDDRGSRVPNWRATGKNALKGVANPHNAPAQRQQATPSAATTPSP
jgi:parvulin-like peptidyl-prolyl isomerase